MSKKRISKVTTRTGDRGTTKLATGRTVAKDDASIRAIGAVDELNSQIGLALQHVQSDFAATLQQIQQHLFDIGAVLAMEGQFEAPDPETLGEATDRLNETLPPLTEFVLPGGGLAAAQLHVARAVCRRAELDIWHLLSQITAASAHQTSAQYLNRLGDYLFVLARIHTADNQAQWRGPSSS